MAYYIEPDDLLREVRLSRSQNKITPALAKMFMTMVDHCITQPKFNKYTYKDDMKAHALMVLSQGALKYDPDKSAFAFQYYSVAIERAFMMVLKYEKKHRRVRDAVLVKHGYDPSYSFQEEMENEFQERFSDVESNGGIGESFDNKESKDDNDSFDSDDSSDDTDDAGNEQ